MKSFKWYLVLLGLWLVAGWPEGVRAAEEKSLLLPGDCPNCCKKANLYPGIDVENLMKIKYIVKYSKYAKDQEGVGNFVLTDKRGLTRNRKWHRYRVILGDQGIDYKDLIVLTEPQHIKGLAVLTWMYLDPNRERDNWLWLPSQRKLRRAAPAEDDDAAFGSDITTEEVSTRRFEDETYKMISDAGTFEGHVSLHDGKTYYKGEQGWIVEAKPKRDPWYYSKRVIFIPKNLGANINDEIYDPNGKKFKDLFRYYDFRKNGCTPMTYVECVDHRIDHRTLITFDWTELNVGVDEKLLGPKALMRTKW